MRAGGPLYVFFLRRLCVWQELLICHVTHFDAPLSPAQRLKLVEIVIYRTAGCRPASLNACRPPCHRPQMGPPVPSRCDGWSDRLRFIKRWRLRRIGCHLRLPLWTVSRALNRSSRGRVLAPRPRLLRIPRIHRDPGADRKRFLLPIWPFQRPPQWYQRQIRAPLPPPNKRKDRTLPPRPGYRMGVGPGLRLRASASSGVPRPNSSLPQRQTPHRRWQQLIPSIGYTTSMGRTNRREATSHSSRLPNPGRLGENSN